MEELKNLKKRTNRLLITNIILFIFILLCVLFILIEWNYQSVSKPLPEPDEYTLVRIFNATFESYLGYSQTARNAKYIISMVNSTNGRVLLKTDEGYITSTNEITDDKTYTISAEYDSDGRITTIGITTP